MVLVLGSVESFPKSSQVLHDSSVEGEHLIVLPIRVEPHVLVLISLAGQVGSSSPVLPIAAHVLLLGVPRRCSTT